MAGVSLDGDVVGDGQHVAAALDTNDPNNLVHTGWGLKLRTRMAWAVATCGFSAAAFGWWWRTRRPQNIHFL